MSTTTTHELEAEGGDAEGDAHPDHKLLERARQGDSASIAELWNQHFESALWYARKFTTKYEAEDVVSEAFARVISALQNGGGPNSNFGSYLRSAIRSTVIGWSRRPPPLTLDRNQWEIFEGEPAGLDSFERIEIVKVFQTLPLDWQVALWEVEVRGSTSKELAELLDRSIGATYVLVHRARQGIREAWDRHQSVDP